MCVCVLLSQVCVRQWKETPLCWSVLLIHSSRSAILTPQLWQHLQHEFGTSRCCRSSPGEPASQKHSKCWKVQSCSCHFTRHTSIYFSSPLFSPLLSSLFSFSISSQSSPLGPFPCQPFLLRHLSSRFFFSSTHFFTSSFLLCSWAYRLNLFYIPSPHFKIPSHVDLFSSSIFRSFFSISTSLVESFSYQFLYLNLLVNLH